MGSLKDLTAFYRLHSPVLVAGHGVLTLTYMSVIPDCAVTAAINFELHERFRHDRDQHS